MTQPPDGGSAYPWYGGHSACIPSEGCRNMPGMTLRDYFAASALPKCLEEGWGQAGGAAEIARGAYQIADAMLAARSAK